MSKEYIGANMSCGILDSFLQSIIVLGLLLSSESMANTISLCPVGTVLGGLSYVEYDQSIRPSVSLGFRVAYMSFDETVTQGDSELNKERNGFGVSLIGRKHWTVNETRSHLYTDVGSSVSWIDWEDKAMLDNSQLEIFEGAGVVAAAFTEIGYRVSIIPAICVDPALHLGWYMSSGFRDNENSIKLIPLVSIGIRF